MYNLKSYNKVIILLMNVFVLFLFLLFSAAGGCNDVTDVIEFIMLPPCCLTIKVICFLISYTKEGIERKTISYIQLHIFEEVQCL